MIIERYLQWVETAPLAARVDAAWTLVAAYTSPELTPEGRNDAELALFALLDDPAMTVRRALSEAVASAIDVPRHLVAALALDQSSVAIPVLWRSPLLDDADLVDAVAVGDAAAQQAVALRPQVRAPVAAAIAEVGSAVAVIALLENCNADVLPCATRRIIERFCDNGAVREALLERDDLDPTMRHDLVTATVTALTTFATGCDWLSPERADRLARESRDKATVTIASRTARLEGAAGTRLLVAHLRRTGHLTPALLLRSLLSGNLALFESALSDLSGMAPIRVAGHVRTPIGLGFAALYGKAGLPQALMPLFRAALIVLREGGWERTTGLQRPIIIRVLDACAATNDPDIARVAALLRRFEAEAVRDEARAIAASAWTDDAADAVPALMPWLVGSPHKAPQLTFQSAA